MSWNVFLAAIPFLLAKHLFAPQRKISLTWSLGLVFFVLFLPNAPYILTDLIHLYEDAFYLPAPKLFLVTLQFLILESIGFWLFVESYRRFEKFILRKRYHLRYLVRLVSFITLSVGVYIGRFLRFNSWDVFTKPQNIMNTVYYFFDVYTMYTTGFITMFTLILLGLYYLHEKLLYDRQK
jgi:uncharacterized membrane protein